MYTDGLHERRDDPADGLTRLRDVATGLRHFPVAQMGQRLADEMLAGSPTEDDVCVLIIRNPDTPARGVRRPATVESARPNSSSHRTL
jgi:hypothetical protein